MGATGGRLVPGPCSLVAATLVRLPHFGANLLSLSSILSSLSSTRLHSSPSPTTPPPSSPPLTRHCTSSPHGMQCSSVAIPPLPNQASPPSDLPLALPFSQWLSQV